MGCPVLERSWRVTSCKKRMGFPVPGTEETLGAVGKVDMKLCGAGQGDSSSCCSSAEVTQACLCAPLEGKRRGKKGVKSC